MRGATVSDVMAEWKTISDDDDDDDGLMG